MATSCACLYIETGHVPIPAAFDQKMFTGFNVCFFSAREPGFPGFSKKVTNLSACNQQRSISLMRDTRKYSAKIVFFYSHAKSPISRHVRFTSAAAPMLLEERRLPSTHEFRVRVRCLAWACAV